MSGTRLHHLSSLIITGCQGCHHSIYSTWVMQGALEFKAMCKSDTVIPLGYEGRHLNRLSKVSQNSKQNLRMTQLFSFDVKDAI